MVTGEVNPLVRFRRLLSTLKAFRLGFGTADILAQEMNLPKNIPDDLSELLQVMATDFPAILSGNLVGIYLWGSLTYETFDETYSDVDCIGVTRRDLDDRKFPELDEWFNTSAGHEYSASWLGTAIKCEDDLDQVVCSQQTFCKGRSSDTCQTTR